MKKPTFWMFTHNFTNTGAPLVLADLAREMADFGLRNQIRVVSWGGKHDVRHSTLQNELISDGIACQILDSASPIPIPDKSDRVLLNSLALPEHIIKKSLDWLRKGSIRRLDWFAHEGNPETWLASSEWIAEIVEALNSGRLHLRVPSIKVLETYRLWLKYDGLNLAIQNPRLFKTEETKELFLSPLPTFDTLRFQITAMAGAGQKGHLWLVNLLRQVLMIDQDKVSSLRPIELFFIGLETGPYAAFSREICRQATDLLGQRFVWTEHGMRKDALATMRRANISVCCSLSETFSLVSVEAMALGQPVLRNRTGGFDEQLHDQVNGFDLGAPSPKVTDHQVQLIRKLRDPLKVSNRQLVEMSCCARDTAKQFSLLQYSGWLLHD